jgi:hypothetical protein
VARGRRVCWELGFQWRSDVSCVCVCVVRWTVTTYDLWAGESSCNGGTRPWFAYCHCVFCRFLLQSLRAIFLCGAVTCINYLDMLQPWLMPQLQEYSENFIFQQDGAPPHFHFDRRAHLNANLAGRRIGHTSDNDSPLRPWPPRSPDLTPCDIFLWGYIKDRMCPLYHVIYHSYDKGSWRQSLLPTLISHCVAGTWLHDWRLPRYQGWIYLTPVR